MTSDKPSPAAGGPRNDPLVGGVERLSESLRVIAARDAELSAERRAMEERFYAARNELARRDQQRAERDDAAVAPETVGAAAARRMFKVLLQPLAPQLVLTTQDDLYIAGLPLVYGRDLRPMARDDADSVLALVRTEVAAVIDAALEARPEPADGRGVVGWVWPSGLEDWRTGEWDKLDIERKPYADGMVRVRVAEEPAAGQEGENRE